MKLTEEQINLLIKEYNKTDKFGPYLIRPLYIAKNSDGELISYIGNIPEKDENGDWGGEDVIPYYEFNKEETAILSCFEFGHEHPFDILKMINSKRVQTTEEHPYLENYKTKEVLFVPKEDKDKLISFLHTECQGQRVATIERTEVELLPPSDSLNINAFRSNALSKEEMTSVLRIAPSIFILESDRSLDDFKSKLEWIKNGSLEDFVKNSSDELIFTVHNLSEQGYLVVVLEV